MNIERIAIENLGPFVGNNEIIFSPKQNTHITLIGGKNGSGKTTMFNSIKIALYGCKNFGYEVNSSQYFAKIKNLINDKVIVKRVSNASVTIDIRLNENNHFGLFTIKRSWSIDDGQIAENYVVYKNNKELPVEDINDFENYLMDLIPPSLFNFYFFDGEKIKEQLSDGQTNKFKDAFVKICGLDNLDILINCFKESYEEVHKDSKISKMYFFAKKNYQNLLSSYNSKLDEINDLNERIDVLMNDIKKNRLTYLKKSGGTIQEWKEISQKIADEDLKRETYRKELKDFANNGLPFIILKNKLNSLYKKIDKECKNTIYRNGIKFFNDPNIKRQISKYLKNKNDYKTILKNITKEVSKDLHSDIYYDISLNDANRVLALIDEKNKINKFDYIEKEKLIKESLDVNKYLNKKIDSIDISKYKEFSKQDYESGKRIDSLLNVKNIEMTKLHELESELKEYSDAYEKAKKSYEEVIKKESLNSISSRAYLRLNEYSQNLYSKFINKFVESFTDIFNSLINKKNLIDGIYVSNDISIYPYRNTTVNRDDISKKIKKIGESKFINEVGEYGFSKYMKSRTKKIVLPVKINGTLSEGETQIYLMSVYYALMSLSSKNIPFIIDTPFARIDSEHRSNLLDKFFLKLRGQLMILSTDEEVDMKCIKVIEKYINNVYLFTNKGDGVTKIFSNLYFEGYKK